MVHLATINSRNPRMDARPLRTVSDNVLRIAEVWLLHSYYLRFWQFAVIRSQVPPDSETAMEGGPLNTIKQTQYTFRFLINSLNVSASIDSFSNPNPIKGILIITISLEASKA